MVLQEVRRRQLLYNKRHRYWDYCPLTRTQKHTNIQPSKAEVIISIRKSLLYMNFDIFLLVSKDKSFTSLSFLEGRACLFAWCVRECVFVCLCLMFLEKVLFFFFFEEGQERRMGWFFFVVVLVLCWWKPSLTQIRSLMDFYSGTDYLGTKKVQMFSGWLKEEQIKPALRVSQHSI